MNKKIYIKISFVFGILAMSILAVIIFYDKLSLPSQLQDRAYYFLLVFLGLCTGIILFGLFSAYAVFEGRTNNFSIKLGGSVAIATLVVIGGFELVPKNTDFDFLVRVHDSTGKPAYSESHASIRILFATGTRESFFNSAGEATFKSIPAQEKWRRYPVDINVEGFKSLSQKDSIAIAPGITDINLLRDYDGTPLGFALKKTGNLALLKLLIPFRSLGSVADLESSLNQYERSEFRARLLSIPLDTIINLNDSATRLLFDILSQQDQSCLTGRHTLRALIQQAAIQFVQTANLVDPHSPNPPVFHELQVIRGSAMIIRASDGFSSSQRYLDAGFVTDFTTLLGAIQNRNKLNPFATFFRM